MNDRVYQVLYLCTGNSARSIIAEALTNAMGQGRFIAHSAGSRPAGQVNPLALELLRKNRIPTDGLRSKSWEEFAKTSGADEMDFVFTVCGSAAKETCPVWPGQPVSAHWAVDDPAAVEGEEDAKRKAFLEAYLTLQRRISIFVSLPLRNLDSIALQKRVSDIGTQ